MATTLTRQGGLLKIDVDGTLQTPISLDEIKIVRVKGSNVVINDGTTLLYTDVTAPTVSSAEELADAICDFIYDYNTGS